MKKNQSAYIAKPVDATGIAHYTDEENATWQTLMTRQQPILKHRACDEFIQGLAQLQLPEDRIPQCKEVSAVLQNLTGWALEPVAALISFDKFFNLLANRRFPAATFIRRKEELDYLKEPDIFHEIFGHCPLLTNPAYAEFVHAYGKLGVNASPKERVLLARLFWFTIEFGLLNTPEGLRAYGGGILSSAEETVFCIESKAAERKPFKVEDALRTPYHIDAIQPTYFVLDRFDELFELTQLDLLHYVREALQAGDYAPLHAC